MSGTLYLVSTPIGNLADMTLRAVDVLRSVDFILAEDTRTSLRILQHYDVQTPFFSSVYQGAERQRIASILDLLGSGKQLALISDAGTPLISDPGYPTVRAVIEGGFAVVPVPGACAALAGLSASGFPTDRFRFLGSLPRGRGARLSLFESLAGVRETCIAYESCHRIMDSLQILDAVLPDRPIAVARELTKVHEEVLRGTASDIHALLATREGIKGEFVLLIRGSEHELSLDRTLVNQVFAALREEDLPNKTIAKILSKGLGMARNDAYTLVHRSSDNESAEKN